MATRFFDLTPDQAPQPGEPRRLATQPSPKRPDIQTVPVATEARLALLIGNARYKRSPLANPVRDVELLGDVLGSLGFTVTVVRNADKDALLGAVRDFAAALDEAGPGAVAFFYFAGHGIQDGGVNYLLPVDLELPSARYLRARALAVDEIVASLVRLSRKANVLVLDACRNAPPDIASDTHDMTQGLAALRLTPDGMLVVYSTAAGAVADDGSGRNSPYAAALAQALPALLEPGRRLHDVFVDAADRVKASTKGQQNPALFLQGALPALDVGDADLQRFKTWKFRRHKSIREWIVQGVGGLTIALIALVLVLTLVRAYPETRARLWERLGLPSGDLFDFACDAGKPTPDRYGLVSADWCRRSPLSLVATVKRAGTWETQVKARLPLGDPKAMALRAAELALERPAVGSPDYVDMLELARRATAAGLPSGFFALTQSLPLLSTDWAAFIAAARSEHVEDAARHGSVLAKIFLVYVDAVVDPRPPREIVEAAASLIPDDESGEAALLAALVSLTGPPAVYDLDKAQAWLRTAASKGSTRALVELDNLARDGRINLPNAELDRYIGAAVERGGVDSQYWKADMLLTADYDGNAREAANLLAISSSHGHILSMARLGRLYLQGLVDGKTDLAQATMWLERAARSGQQSAIADLAKLLTLGVTDRDGRRVLPAEPQVARPYWERLTAMGNDNALLSLGELFEIGAFGAVDRNAARDLYERAAAHGGRRTSDTAKQNLERLRRADLLAAPAHRAMIATGPVDAPVAIELFTLLACDRCGDWMRDVVEPLIAKYVTTGFARFTLRQIYNLDAAANDVTIGAVIRCLPEAERVGAALHLLVTATSWQSDPARTISSADVIAQLPGTTTKHETLEACARSPLAKAVVEAERDFTVNDLGLGRPPSILVNGDERVGDLKKRPDDEMTTMIENLIRVSIRPQDRERLPNPNPAPKTVGSKPGAGGP